MSVARYDRGLAARLLRPELDAMGTAPSPLSPVSHAMMDGANAGRALAALALADPRQAVGRIERLAQREGTRTFDGPIRIQVATILALRGPERWRRVDTELNLPSRPLHGVDR